MTTSVRTSRQVMAWFFLGCLIPLRAAAQGHYTAEELRDLGRPVTPGATTLSLGGTRGSGLGDATDAAFNPAALVLGPRTDAVVSLGGFRYGRDELQRTRSGQTFTDSLIPVVSGAKPIGSGAVAFRTSRFGVGVTYDAVSRIDYARDVDRIRWASGHQRITDQRQWSLGVRHQRLGVAFGAVMPGNLAAVGVAIHGARTRIDYQGSGSNSELTVRSDGVFAPVSNADTEARMDSKAWDLGVTLGALMRPHPRVDVSVRYVREPPARVRLEDSYANRDPAFNFTRVGFTLIRETDAFLDPPDLVSAGATVRLGEFRVVGEAGAVLAARTFHDASSVGTNECGGVPVTQELRESRYILRCWQLYTRPTGFDVAMANGADVRVGVERGWHRRQVSWWLRGGASREAAAVLQTTPPVDDAFVPPDGDRTWVHAGGGVRIGRTITDVGVARWREQYRVLVDVRWATGRDAHTLYGIRH